ISPTRKFQERSRTSRKFRFAISVGTLPVSIFEERSNDSKSMFTKFLGILLNVILIAFVVTVKESLEVQLNKDCGKRPSNWLSLRFSLVSVEQLEKVLLGKAP
ncbi:hypothetical protein CR513_24959, partial [Mucuna pruriens]